MTGKRPMSSVGTKCPDGGTKCRRRKCPWGTLEHRRWLEFGLGTNARPTEVPLGEIRLEPIRQGEGVSRASSQAAYPSFPPKGEKLAHSAVPEVNPLGGLLLSPPNPPDGWASAGTPLGGRLLWVRILVSPDRGALTPTHYDPQRGCRSTQHPLFLLFSVRTQSFRSQTPESPSRRGSHR